MSKVKCPRSTFSSYVQDLHSVKMSSIYLHHSNCPSSVSTIQTVQALSPPFKLSKVSLHHSAKLFKVYLQHSVKLSKVYLQHSVKLSKVYLQHSVKLSKVYNIQSNFSLIALICDWCVCACVCVWACKSVCACMLYALNFDNMYL